MTALVSNSFFQTTSFAQDGGKDLSRNPLLTEWTGPYGGVPPWRSVEVNDFVPAFEKAIEMAKADIDAIAAQTETPTFDNTMVPLEKAGAALDRLERIFGVHTSNLNVGDIPDMETKVAPMMSKHGDWVIQHEGLFKRIEAVFNSDEMKTMSVAQKRLVDDRYKTFVRRGAKLNAEDKAKLSTINTDLASLFTRFSQNVLGDEGKLFTVVEESQLAGLPESVVDGMAASAKERKLEGYVINNTRSSMEPVLTYAEDRSLREKVWTTYYSRGDNGDDRDNNEIIASILKLRAQRALLLGYETHAHWRLEPQMAKTPDKTMELMLAVWPKAVARVKEEVADMQAVADREGSDFKIAAWDYRYYAEKVRKEKYDLDLNEVKPYLQMEKLRDGMMWAAGEVYGFTFKPIDNVPNNSNFVKGKDGEPVLISWDDAVTMFHEFGHALHGLSSQCEYKSQSGTSVARDYVEFPSQINEHWLMTPEILERFAVHFETGEPMPKELVEKIKKAATFNQGFSTVEYLGSALIDMKLHLAGNVTIDPDKFEKEELEKLGMPSEICMRHRTPQFNHIFADDGYSAGYYSYLWSDALTADAAEVFEEAGSYYDPAASKSLYDNVFSVGDTIDPAEGFRRFRGRDVDTKALLRKRGFPVD
jgi:peptidyl-dipeptidase Dcp